LGDNHLKKQKIAITGYDGFIGRYLCSALSSLEIHFETLGGDILSSGTWKNDYELLFHLAASMPNRFVNDPRAGFYVNVAGTYQALEACRKQKAHLVFTSTCGVYSPSVVGKISEDSPTQPQSDYALSKLISEYLCQTYSERFGISCTILRFFNVYGFGQPKDYLIPYLVSCTLQEIEAIVYNPDSHRDFIYISDVVLALLQSTASRETFEIYNIGYGENNSVRSVIDLIDDITGKPLKWSK
jgi:UDP-glucose 4-epimerase